MLQFQAMERGGRFICTQNRSRQKSGPLSTGHALQLNNDEATDELQLTTPSEFSDVTLVVEGRKLYTSRAILASASPVWRAMLTSEFEEKTQPEIPLPGKSYRDVCELLLCVTPGTKKQITGE